MLKEGVQSLGPNMLLKVMAGDHVSASAQYYWLGTPDNSPGGLNLLGNIVAGMMNAISNGSVAGSIKGSATAIGNQYTQNPGGLGALINQYNDPLSDRPLAFLNILFLDENFNLVPFDPVTQLGSFSIQVGNSGDGQPPIIASQIRVPRNGYAYVYLTNNSRTAVYFDNFRIVHDRGRLVEENAYYPYGLKIKSLCAKAFDKGENKYGYQSCFSEEEMQTGWNEFNYRMYNPKTGVWNSPDPMDEFAGPYSSMGSNPSIFTDPSGGSINELLGNALNENFLGTAVGALVGTTVGIITAGQSPGKKFSNGAVGFFAGAIMGNLVQSNGFDIWEAAVDIAPMASNATGSGSPGLHSVWVISNTWNDAYIQKFNASVSVYMSQFENAAQTFTCDDLALELIIQFAKDNHLPFKWEVAEMTYDANATSLANFETFLLHVKIHSGAPDFQRASNTNTINQDAVNGGSMILNEGSRLVAHHVQVVTSVYRDMGMVRGINVRQGNFRSPVWIWNRFTGSDDPRSWRYLGVTPQMGYYNTELDIFRNMTLNRTTMDFSKIEHLVYIQFNFQRWNK
jgi:RHS repeat-associated protein